MLIQTMCEIGAKWNSNQTMRKSLNFLPVLLVGDFLFAFIYFILYLCVCVF